MHTISLERALDIWSELETAYHNTNGYGGNEAEIYIYKVMPSTPMADKISCIDDPGICGDMVREAYNKANKALFSILNHFSEKRNAIITVEGRTLGEWLINTRYTHRVHVHVFQKLDVEIAK
jgi:hypothetical protein